MNAHALSRESPGSPEQENESGDAHKHSPRGDEEDRPARSAE